MIWKYTVISFNIMCQPLVETFILPFLLTLWASCESYMCPSTFPVLLISNSLKREAVPLLSEITLLQTLYDMQRIIINYRPHSYKNSITGFTRIIILSFGFASLPIIPFMHIFRIKFKMPALLPFLNITFLFFFKQKLLCCSRIFF